MVGKKEFKYLRLESTNFDFCSTLKKNHVDLKKLNVPVSTFIN